jgi:mono/diheme cytochrome c family protein
MKTYETLGLVALLLLVVLLPVYALQEPARLARVQAETEARYVSDAAHLYLDSCALCHGADGAGLGAMPPLNYAALAEANAEVLYNTIAYSPHGSAMASWHVDEGGTMSGYQVESLVTLIKSRGWDTVSAMAETSELSFIAPPDAAALDDLEPGDAEDPHECRSCHEEPVVHAERFGLNCARCHSLQSWKPALLTKHTFRLDHGEGAQIACQTCHTETYAEHTCYGCHDHQAAEMETAHVELGIIEYDNCALCHPTGEPGEARNLQAGETAPAVAEVGGN